MAEAARHYLARAQRFPLQVPVQYQRSGNSHWHEGRTVNISRTGILFQTDEPLPQTATLDIRLEFPANVMIFCQGSIIRSEPSAFAIRIHRYQLGRS